MWVCTRIRIWKIQRREIYRFPPVDLLKNHKCERSGVSARELDENINRLKSVLPDCKIEIAL